MKHKTCFKCRQSKPLSAFYKHPQMPDGHVNKCKECNKADVRKNYADNIDAKRDYNKQRQRHSKTRIFNHRYSGLVARCEGRVREGYSSAGTIPLSRSEYDTWLVQNMDVFDKIYIAWEASGFQRRLAPSIDRINNKLGYIPENMQWLPLHKNSEKFKK